MLLRALLAFALPIFSLHAQTQLPHFDAEALSGQKLSMPAAVQGHPAILIVCFTHASGPECTDWAKRLNAPGEANGNAAVYTAIFLEDAPRLVRGMAIHGIKSGVAKDQYSHYLIVTEHEKEMKSAVGFSEPNDAYVVALAPDGSLRGVTRGAVTDNALRQIRTLESQ